MNIALRQPMTIQAFLAWEERQPLRYEFDGLQPVAMTGGTLAHGFIQRNLAISVGGRLLGKRCQFVGSDVKVAVGDSIRYPDGFVVCEPGSLRLTVVRNPVVIFEVLSPSTSGVDRIVKNREYAATPSVLRYVMLEQDSMAATVYARAGEDWRVSVVVGDEVLAMPEIGVEMPLSELYRGVTFDDAGAEAAGG